MTQLAFSFNASRCSGCMACVIACQDQNDIISETVAFRQITSYEEGSNQESRIHFISLSCQHCGDAPCVMVCPTGAVFKNSNGVIELNRDLCIGCHSCELTCAFGAPKFAEDGKMVKCNFCHDRVEYGLKPACVRVCPTKALGFGPLEEITRNKSQKASIRIIKSLIGSDSSNK